MERRGTCSVCQRNTAITVRGKIRQHAVPQDPDLPRWRNKHREICAGTGEMAITDSPIGNAEILAMDLAPDLKTLALLYNRMHHDLCQRGQFCSAHQPAASVIEAVRREQR